MKKFLSVLLISMSILLAFPLQAYADSGPKPTLKIIVENPPSEEYYLDLLIDYPNANYSWLDKEKFNPEKLELLNSYRDGNWRPALVTGTIVPMSSSGLIGKVNGNTMIHDFGYIGVPNKFKIIILTNDNKIISSKEVNTYTFDSVVYYDFETNKVKTTSSLGFFALKFLGTCILTLLIEGFIMLFFKFSIKKNWKVFLSINVVTQLLLYICLLLITARSSLIYYLTTIIPIELLILIIEAVYYSKKLKEHSIIRRINYAVVANILSFILGLFIIR